ncbi:MAG TPA: hypothetical protein VMU63_08030 [Acidimicrobiales bacterium]|nr:hypothetical protein [Acidimicrobiales bacterium]
MTTRPPGRNRGHTALLLLGQVAVADTACIVLLPLAEQPGRALPAAAAPPPGAATPPAAS